MTQNLSVCFMCGGSMKKTTKSSGNCLGITIALALFAFGALLTIFVPIIGWIMGPLICICSLFVGGKRQKMWRCTKCRASIARS